MRPRRKRLPCVAAQKMRLAAPVMFPHLVYGQLARVQLHPQFAQLALFLPDFLRQNLAHHLAAVCQDKPPAQQPDALPQRMDHRLFRMQRQPALSKMPAQGVKAVLQVFAALMHQNEVIRKAHIGANMQPFLDEVIHIVQHSQLCQLAALASKSRAAVAAKAVDDVHATPCSFFVRHARCNRCFRYAVRRGFKELAQVAPQHPAVRVKAHQCLPRIRLRLRPLPPPVPFQMTAHAIQRIVHAAAFDARGIVSDEVPRNFRRQHFIAQRSLKLPVFDARGYNVAFFRLMNGKTLVGVNAVGSTQK